MAIWFRLCGLPMEYAFSPIIVRTLGPILGDVVAVGPMNREDFNPKYASIKSDGQLLQTSPYRLLRGVG